MICTSAEDSVGLLEGQRIAVAAPIEFPASTGALQPQLAEHRAQVVDQVGVLVGRGVGAGADSPWPRAS